MNQNVETKNAKGTWYSVAIIFACKQRCSKIKSIINVLNLGSVDRISERKV